MDTHDQMLNFNKDWVRNRLKEDWKGRGRMEGKWPFTIFPINRENREGPIFRFFREFCGHPYSHFREVIIFSLGL